MAGAIRDFKFLTFKLDSPSPPALSRKGGRGG